MQLRKPISLILIAMLLFSTSVILLPSDSVLAGVGPTFESSHDGDDSDGMGKARHFPRSH